DGPESWPVCVEYDAIHYELSDPGRIGDIEDGRVELSDASTGGVESSTVLGDQPLQVTALTPEMNHGMAGWAHDSQVAQLRLRRCRAVSQWLRVVDMGEPPAKLAVDRAEIEVASLDFASEAPARGAQRGFDLRSP